MFKYKLYIFVFFLWLFSSLPLGEGWGGAFAQIYPVQLNTLLTPPFNGHIPDYSTPGNANLKLLVLFTDFTKPAYQIKLKIAISGQGIDIKSKSYYYSQPFTITPGIPTEISGSDLAGLLSPVNLDISGISPQHYQTKVLPEGFYNICFTAYDYNNPIPIQVSNQSCANGYMVLSEVPFLNLPMCESTVSANNPQNVMFQWTPMNFGSPNSFNTVYDFELYEVRPSTQNPGNVIQTLPPIYQTTTPFTFVNYGITEPQLYYGMQYVWRVRARDQSGLDLYKNQGYSQQCTFTYGSVLSQIDSNSLKLNLQAQAMTYRAAKCTWDSLGIFVSYRLEYRKQGYTNWFGINTTKQKSNINNLEPENTYETRVKGLFSEGSGPWSNIATFTTPPQVEIQCGQAGVPPSMANFVPLTTGSIGQVWNIGQFDMTVTQLDNPNNPNGRYSGYGKVAIPFLAGMSFTVKFTNIAINEAMQLADGEVEAVSEGMDEWLKQWEAPYGWNESNNLTYDGVITNITADSTNIIINGQSFSNTGQNTVITDTNGNTYYVSANGSISSPEGPIGSPVSDTLAVINDSLPTIVFSNGTNAQFAFDSKETATQTAGKNYDILQKGADTYPVGCKLLQTGQSDKLIATLTTTAPQQLKPNSLVFKRTDGTIVPSVSNGNNTYELTVKGKLNLYADALWAFGKKNNSTDTALYPLGKVNLISVDKKKKKIVLIPVNTIGNNLNATDLQTQLNAIYKKVGVEWEVSKAPNLQVNGYTSDSLLTVSRSALNITYGADLRKIINAYKAVNPNSDEKTAYLFLVNKASNNDLGYMALNKKFGFIFLNNNTNVAHTIAHEIGHGSLVLAHTFIGTTSGSSQNLMDYNGGELFDHQQFKAIHDPNIIQNFINTLVQDEDAGAYSFFDLEAFLKDKLGITCYNTYNNYDGVMPECFWNNSLQDNIPDNGYGCALVCGVIDGVFVTIKDIYSVMDFIGCYSANWSSSHCDTVRKEVGEIVSSVKQVLETPTGYISILLELDKALGNWAGETFCTDRTCAYNQGRLIFDIVSMFYGVGELKTALKTGIAGTKIAKMISSGNKTMRAVTKALRASSLKAQKIAAGFQLSVQLNTGIFFDIGKLEAASKALRFNVPPAVASAFPDAEVITRLDDVAYLVQENGVSVVKHGNIEIIDNGATAVVRLGNDIASLLARWDNLTIAEAKNLYTQLVKTEIQGSKVVRTQAEILQEIQQRGITNPYSFARSIEDFTLSKDAFFVRAYNQNKVGRWLISIDDIDGFTSVDDFISKTALPVVDDIGSVLKPNKMLIVKIPSGTTIRKSVARPQDWGGQGHLSGGATQYEIINFSSEEMNVFFKDMGNINEYIK